MQAVVERWNQERAAAATISTTGLAAPAITTAAAGAATALGSPRPASSSRQSPGSARRVLHLVPDSPRANTGDVYLGYSPGGPSDATIKQQQQQLSAHTTLPASEHPQAHHHSPAISLGSSSGGSSSRHSLRASMRSPEDKGCFVGRSLACGSATAASSFGGVDLSHAFGASTDASCCIGMQPHVHRGMLDQGQQQGHAEEGTPCFGDQQREGLAGEQSRQSRRGEAARAQACMGAGDMQYAARDLVDLCSDSDQ